MKLGQQNGRQHRWAKLEPTFKLLRWAKEQKGDGTPDISLLVEELQRPVFSSALRILKRKSVKNPADDARDAVQSWFVHLLEHIEYYDVPIHRTAYDCLDCECSYIVRDRLGGFRRDYFAYIDPPARPAELKELRESVDGALDRMSCPIRAVIAAKYGFSTPADLLARVQNIDPDTFERLAAEGEANLREYLKPLSSLRWDDGDYVGLEMLCC